MLCLDTGRVQITNTASALGCPWSGQAVSHMTEGHRLARRRQLCLGGGKGYWRWWPLTWVSGTGVFYPEKIPGRGRICPKAGGYKGAGVFGSDGSGAEAVGPRVGERDWKEP